nr:carboxypeptidase-like regulatory domain-containing protein [Candidatus Freyrarchaeum guaymaensis]
MNGEKERKHVTLKRKIAMFFFALLLAALTVTPIMLSTHPVYPVTPPTSSGAMASAKSSSTPPQDVPPWWNTTFKYRIPVNVNVADTVGVSATVPVDVYIDFTQLGYTCHKDSIRIQYWNGSSWLASPGLPYQVWNQTLSGDNIQKATITFYANLTPHQTTTYYIYFNNEQVEPPSFTPQITITETSDSITVTGDHYTAYIYKTTNGGKIYESFNSFYGDNWSLAPFHDNPTFRERWFIFWSTTWTTNGSPSSGPFYDSGPLFATVTSEVRFKSGNSTLDTYANVTYRFFRWGWICNTTTVFLESFSSNIDYISFYESCGWSFDPQVMPKLVYKAGGFVYEEDMIPRPEPYLSKSAEWFCTLDEMFGTAAGIVDITPPQFHVTDPQSVRWSFFVYYGTNYEYWYRSTTEEMFVEPGDWISENYAFYLWNGTQGSEPFENFAEGMKHKAISLGSVEERFFTVTVHVEDLDGLSVSDALVEVRNFTTNELLIDGTSNGDGDVTFYLYEDNYTVSVTYNETHEGVTYQTYTNSTSIEVENDHLSTTIILDVVNLYCHVIYPSGNNFPFINVTINTTGTPLFVSGITNATGWVTFRLPRNSYNICLYEGGEPREVNESLNVSIDLTSEDTPCTAVLICTTYATLTETSIIIENGTSLPCTWTPYEFLLQVRWRNETGGALIDRSANSSYYLQYRLLSDSTVILDWTNFTQPAGELNYIANLTGLLYGGVTYTVEMRAGGEGIESTSNQTVIIVNPVSPDVTIGSLAGVHYWNSTDIPLWVRVYDGDNGFPVTEASVTWSIEGYGSFTLTHAGDGNYTGSIPKDMLPPGDYVVRFSVECENYTSYADNKPLRIQPRPLKLSFNPTYEVVFGDNFTFYVYCTDNLTGAPLPSAVQIVYFIGGTGFSGSLVDVGGDGNYTASFQSSLLPSGASYSVGITAYLENYTAKEDKIWLYVEPVPMAIQQASVSETEWREPLNVSITLWDTHNNVSVGDAVVNCTILRDGSVVLEAELTSLGNGTYTLTVDTTSLLPGKYTVIFYAFKGNYSAEPRQVEFNILRIATSATPSNLLLLGGASPYLVLAGGYGEVENNVPLVVLFFDYRDAGGNPVPGATVTANGIPLTHVGGGRYALIVPTSLPPSTIPLVVSASAENYEPAQTFQVVVIKEWGVTIPGLNVRVSFTLLAVICLAVLAPPASLAGYITVRRIRTPPIIRKIDSLIEAIEKGKPFRVEKPLSRESVIKSLLAEELAIVGVEPRVEAYVPVEMADKLVPLLVESGLSEETAIALLRELRSITPAERERLLASVGVPSEISAIIMRELEMEAEERKG